MRNVEFKFMEIDQAGRSSDEGERGDVDDMSGMHKQIKEFAKQPLRHTCSSSSPSASNTRSAD
jgi:hypothetical protein